MMKRRMDVVLLFTLSLIFFPVFTLQTGQRGGSVGNDFRELEQEVVKELNTARTTPRSYASHLKDMRRYFYGKELRRPGEIAVLTKEGDAAVVEAIRFLKKVKPIPPLKLSQGMSQGAHDHVEVQGRNGTVGHGSNEGSQPWERINRYGTWNKIVGENIAYGCFRPRDVVTSLIIDDGIPGRGHRKNIFNPNFRVVGVAWGPHKIYGTMCVIIFAGEYLEKKEWK
jgi:uncharacterized protein YkwD